ncbi:hypothetical protein HZH66_005687 [Vespula vulgaris]|uniref:Uncharacterized protein n=1 Tax=Vespula vulgaris TaxID=7454 RepID=A0A834NAP5_VESVU|nr:hypothetical protein HZH66_005687 [Vespula vulgaris]
MAIAMAMAVPPPPPSLSPSPTPSPTPIPTLTPPLLSSSSVARAFPPPTPPPPYHLPRKPVCPSFHSRFDFHSTEFCKCMYLLRVVKVTRDKGRRKFSNTGDGGSDGGSANGLLRGY